jgi:sRNA-binding protein
MKLIPILVFMSSAGLIFGCQTRDTQKEKKEVETKTETTKSGEPVKSETEVRKKTPDGKSEMKNETVVGTVTEFKPGEKIKVKAEDGRSHEFDLDQEGAAISVEPSVHVGTKVQIVVDKLDDRVSRITIAPHA